MFENDRENELLGGGNDLDLGSIFEGENPFGDSPADTIAELADGNAVTEFAAMPEEKADAVFSETAPTAEAAAEPEEKTETTQGQETNTEPEEEEHDTQTNLPQGDTAAKAEEQPEQIGDTPNLFDAAIAKAETKQAESAKSGLVDKLPVFSYAKAEEEIADPSKTFDQLRNEKAEDFPELDDGTSVSWKMVYGTITKSIPNPKKTTIISMKKKIEDSKEFVEMLKKAKGDVICKVTPSVSAKKKGVMQSYKGAFATVDDAVASGKIIGFVPSDDGKVYEVRPNKIGTFIAPANNAGVYSKVRAGFIPALPKIPYETLAQIISFFRSYVTAESALEAMVYVYWSNAEHAYFAYAPKQTVTKDSIETTLPGLDEDDFTLVMEIHSHNTMEAYFSSTDNADEKATRLYTVIGRLDKLFPDLKTRASVGGKFIDVSPAAVFEMAQEPYPQKWRDMVEIAKPKEAGKE